MDTTNHRNMTRLPPLALFVYSLDVCALLRLSDIHKNDTLNLIKHRVQEMDTDEMRYADDTICISEDEEALSRLLAAIEVEVNKYGLKLNKKTCKCLHFGSAGRVYFADGTPVLNQNEVKYLGCYLKNKADPDREQVKRKKACMITLNKLHLYLL